MPIIQVNLLKGRSPDVKRKYAADLTKMTCENFDVTPDKVRIIFHDMEPHDIAVAGVLASDKKS